MQIAQQHEKADASLHGLQCQCVPLHIRKHYAFVKVNTVCMIEAAMLVAQKIAGHHLLDDQSKAASPS